MDVRKCPLNLTHSRRTLNIFRIVSSLFSLSSSLAMAAPRGSSPPTLSRPISKLFPMLNAPIAAAVEGLSKLNAPKADWPIIADVAGDFRTCCGEDLGPRGENAAWAGFENGVDTGGVAPASCEGVRPCWEAACFMGVGVAMAAVEGANCGWLRGMEGALGDWSSLKSLAALRSGLQVMEGTHRVGNTEAQNPLGWKCYREGIAVDRGRVFANTIGMWLHWTRRRCTLGSRSSLAWPQPMK